MKERLAALAMQPMPMSPAEFAAHFRKGVEDIAGLIRRAGIQAD